MPAPKQFKPGPQMIRDDAPVSRAVVTKGRYSVVAPQTPTIDDPGVVEVSIDDVTVVMTGTSKYEQRSPRAYGEIGDELVEEFEEVSPVPVKSEAPTFGEWRSESTLEGTHYHRKDSRRI
ncbi:MAG: hypothetical protein MUQ27_05565 [Acidimicrobiia bacterium]|nr:hypothetical protein [Acidimicrobiia bacterium]